MKNKEKLSRGITLISLVITIIVLLILAGVALTMLSGENGILTRAKTARVQHEAAQELEENRLAGMENVMGQYLGNTASGSTTAITDSTHYGDYFDLGTEILGTVTNGTYSSTKKLEGESTAIKADWRIFSKDSTGVWLILADYLPINVTNINTFITGTETNQIGLVTKTGSDLNSYPYSVWSGTSRSDLITRLTSNWKGLLPSSLQSNTNITAVGALTVSQWQAGWNSKYTGNEQITVSGNETSGYSTLNISSKTGYSNTLYFPHKSAQSNCNGYWLASPHFERH